MIKTAQLPDVW